MTISGIYSGGVSLGAIHYRHGRLNVSGAGGQTADASQTQDASQTGLTAPASPQVAAGSPPAQQAFSAMLGNMAAGGIPRDLAEPSQNQQHLMTPPAQPPAPSAERSASIGSGIVNLLQSVAAGDLSAAQNAISALQAALANLAAELRASAALATPVSATALASSATSQPSFTADLNSLLSAVQSGDAAASKTAASTLMTNLQDRPDAYRALQSDVAAPPGRWRGHGGSFRSNVASLLQSVQAGDMPAARTAGAAIESALKNADTPPGYSSSPLQSASS